MRFNPEKRGVMTGRLAESEYIGEVDTTNPAYQAELKKLQAEAAKKGATDGFISRRAGVDLAKKFQPYDPTNPHEKSFARDIRVSLIDLMIIKGLIGESEEDKDRLKFYTAVNTPLDKFHGVDGFLEFEDKDGGKYEVSFDISLNPHKERYRSDIVVAELPDSKLEEDKLRYLATIEQYAQKALGALQIKMSHEQNKAQTHTLHRN